MYIEKALTGISNFNRLKQSCLRTLKDPVNTLVDQIINIEIRISE